MDTFDKGTFGAWVQATGTVMAAIGSTPFPNVNSNFLNALNLWGNTMQATGNALQADDEESVTLEALGNAVQATGNTVVIAGLVIDFNVLTQQNLVIKGNFLQAIGGLMALAYDWQEDPAPGLAKTILGNILQVIGNTLQAVGGIVQLQSSGLNQPSTQEDPLSGESALEKGQNLVVSGSWIQAIGAVLTAIGQTEASEAEQKEKDNNEKDKNNESSERWGNYYYRL